jgi:enoyl-CoA hydratase/carnithine racemase
VALIEQHVDSHVAMITLNDGQRGNLLCPEALEELGAALDLSLRNPQVRAVLLRSNGPAFCLGMDLSRLAAPAAVHAGTAAEDAVGRYADVLQAIFSSPLPVVCLVEGETKAGGVGIACACDIVLAGEHASFELGEVIFGLIPANVLPYMLAQRMSPQKARYLVMSSRKISASEALRVNLVDEVAADRDIEPRLREIFKRLLCSSPRALAAAKEFTAELAGTTPEEGSALARRKLLQMMRDPATLDGVKAFQEGHMPAWFTRFKPQGPLSLSARRDEKEHGHE